MFGLIRRISYSVIPRPDRPWEDDPTSNAPNPRRKRRISSTEHESAAEEHARKKKARGEDPGNPGSDDIPSSPIVGATNGNEDTDVETDADTTGDAEGAKLGYSVQREGSLEVKVVTKGVNEVELEDKATANIDKATSVAASDAVPALSSESAAESSDATGEPATTTAAAVNPESIPLPEEMAGELDDIRSSSSPVPESTPTTAHAREDSAATAVESSPAEAPKTHVSSNDVGNSEIPASTETPTSRPETPRQSRPSRSAASNKPASAVKKLARSKSPKKVLTRA